ncbi:hypothetical protein BD560DRAFT_380157 [Blakeslea trispora]|nr:hypothetical protein BD560DRAFT_380157 [Blakeslea trispora]
MSGYSVSCCLSRYLFCRVQLKPYLFSVVAPAPYLIATSESFRRNFLFFFCLKLCSAVPRSK